MKPSLKLATTLWCLAFLPIGTSSSWAQSTVPAPVPAQAKSVFNQFVTLNNRGKLDSASAKKLVAGEATEYVKNSGLGDVSAPDAFQLIDARHAVVRVQGLENKVPMADVYFYLDLVGTTWKVSALRSLSMTGMIEMARDEIKQKPQLTAKDQIELANLNLTLSLDKDLRAYFNAHRSQFEQLRALSAKPATAANSVAQKKALEKLGLTAISHEANPCLLFVIGGTVDNLVGYVYSANNKPPKITPNEYIWVEKIADKWYLYRTT